MDIENIESKLAQLFKVTLEWATSPQFYSQCGLIILAIIIAYSLTQWLKTYAPLLKQEPEPGVLYTLRKKVYATRDLLFPLFNILTLSIAIDISTKLVEKSWLIRIAVSLSIILLLYIFITLFIKKRIVKTFVKWILIPIAILQVFGLLDDVTTYLNSISLQIGNINISAYGIARLLVFGVILFWLGRISSNT
ncbi:MAG: hypothetical protein R3321_15455, partial [Nitrososphaeraceae archaeon]|nr:hypothetical protein [Nitrososphaeraceae archaeon]